MSCTVCTQSGVIEDLMRAEGQRGRELDEKSLNPVNQLLRRGASTPPPPSLNTLVVDFNLDKQRPNNERRIAIPSFVSGDLQELDEKVKSMMETIVVVLYN